MMENIFSFTVADLGFPVERGHQSHRGPWTLEAVTFQKFCMSKCKNLDHCGGGGEGAYAEHNTLDLPIIYIIDTIDNSY